MLLSLVVAAGVLPPCGPASADDRAQRILAQAAEVQRGQQALPRPDTLHGLFSITVRKQDDSGTFSLEIERSYLRSPERMLTRRTDSVAGSDSTVGYDGKVFWMRDNRTHRVVVYDDDPETYYTDLQLEREQLQLTRMILDVVSLDGLLQQLGEPRLAGRQTINVPSRRRKGDDRLVDVIRATIPDVFFEPDPASPPAAADAAPALLDVELFIDVQTHLLHRVVLRTRDRAQPQEWQLLLSRHAPNAAGLVVPSTLRVLDGDGDVLATLGLIVDDAGLPRFELGEPLELSLFDRPEGPGDDD